METPSVDTLKACRVCGPKPLTEFHRHALHKDGMDTLCKLCAKARTYAYRAANPGVHAKIQAKYRAANLEKVRESTRKTAAKYDYEKGRPARRWADPVQRLVCINARQNREHRLRANGGRGLTTEELKLLMSKPCHYCGKASREIDHVIPLSRGGKHEPENIVQSCRSCNAKKNARTPEEWRQAC